MLFNSCVFILAFLPAVLLGFYFLIPYEKKWRIYWLISASFVFYGWWDPPYLLLLLASIGVNYGIGWLIQSTRRKLFLIAGIVFNLGLLGYYKYFWFFLSQFYTAGQIEQSFDFASPLLPLGISFFTFQQIAYLADLYQRKVEKHNLPEYALFVSFFPQMAAGPIVYQREILPQLARERTKVYSKSIALGLACFILGLAKKTILADPLGNIANPIFTQSLSGPLGFAESWLGALAYTLQLYFDFSSYSDMAIGLGLLFGIRLPLNFFSPYKAINIIDFWRRWHITLSRFLKDYLYIPLGGNRHGLVRRYMNLMITMLLGGLWHGAGWTFILWGGIHGFYLCINHFWQGLNIRIPAALSWLVTFMAVVFAWVVFRAQTLESALVFWGAMVSPSFTEALPVSLIVNYGMVAAGMIVALCMPNIHQWLRGEWKCAGFPLIGRWRSAVVQGVAFGGLLWGCLLLIQFVQSEFLYFNF